MLILKNVYIVNKNNIDQAFDLPRPHIIILTSFTQTPDSRKSTVIIVRRTLLLF